MIPKTKGDCEFCSATNVQLYLIRNRDLMCQACMDSEPKPKDNPVQFVQDSRKRDSLIEMKPDIFNAATTSIIELRAAIYQDETIQSDKKSYSLVSECATRIDKFDAAIFSLQQQLTTAQNERHAWVVAAQTETAKIREAGRMQQLEECKKFDISYKPPVVKKPAKEKTIKPAKVSKRGPVVLDMESVKAASAKYDIPMSTIQMFLLQRLFATAEEAAKSLREAKQKTAVSK